MLSIRTAEQRGRPKGRCDLEGAVEARRTTETYSLYFPLSDPTSPALSLSRVLAPNNARFSSERTPVGTPEIRAGPDREIYVRVSLRMHTYRCRPA